MGGKGGGGADSGPMLEYGNKALALQEKIYNQTREDSQPWYQTGTSAVNQLSKLLGLSGQSATPANRQTLLDQNRSKFTTQQSTPGGGSMAVGPDGRVYDLANGNWGEDYFKNTGQNVATNGLMSAGDYYKSGDFDKLKSIGFTALNPSTTSNVTDEAGLNSYVDNLIAQGQADVNDPAYGSLAKSFTMDDYQEDPGYQFRLAEGQKALERKLNAAGKTYSPEAAKALMSYGQGLASEEYSNAYDRYNNDQNTLFNRLATLSGYGQTASGQMANAGQNYAQGGTDLYTGMGNSITASNIAKANQGSSMFNTLLGAGAQLGSSYLMSDFRVKENIEHIGEENGYPIYKFNYKTLPHKTYIGVMAQDVEKIKPSAIMEKDGIKYVNYSKIGVQMREVKNAA